MKIGEKQFLCIVALLLGCAVALFSYAFFLTDSSELFEKLIFWNILFFLPGSFVSLYFIRQYNFCKYTTDPEPRESIIGYLEQKLKSPPQGM